VEGKHVELAYFSFLIPFKNNPCEKVDKTEKAKREEA